MEGEGMIKQEQLNAIKERVAKATLGSWKVSYDTDDRDHVVDIWFDGEDNGHVEIHDSSFGNAPYNAKFISHAREDVPTLIAEVERLSEELTQSNIERMSLVVDKAYEKSQKNEYIKTIHLVNEENRRLREALKFYANNSNYLIEWSDKCDEYMPSVADNDGGEIARQALDGEAHE